MKHTSKSFRKEAKRIETKVRHGYHEVFPGSHGKVLAKASKKHAKETHKKFKEMGGTRHEKSYTALKAKIAK